MLSNAEILALIKADNMKQFYNDRAWRYLSKKVIKKHHNECYLCMKAHKMSPATVVHHVKELKLYPQYAYSEYVNGEIQLMPLCHDCHEYIHNRGKYTEQAPKGYINEERW